MNTKPESINEEVPEVVLEEKDDKPAGRGIMWTIIIAVVVLALAYIIFFRGDAR